MSAILDRRARRDRVVALIRAHGAKNQQELQALLLRDGVSVNQATLSRDLRDLGVVKGADGYQLPAAATPPPTPAGGALWPVLRAFLLRAKAAQNLVVLHTPPGGAQPLALALDRAQLAEPLGTIAGDDTVLCVCADARTARSLATRLLRLRGDAA